MLAHIKDIRDPKEIRQYIDRLNISIQSVQRRLRRFEEEFGMDSEAFYARLQNAELSERVEYAEWAGEHEMLERLNTQKSELESRLQQKP
jgi:transposase